MFLTVKDENYSTGTIFDDRLIYTREPVRICISITILRGKELVSARLMDQANSSIPARIRIILKNIATSGRQSGAGASIRPTFAPLLTLVPPITETSQSFDLSAIRMH